MIPHVQPSQPADEVQDAAAQISLLDAGACKPAKAQQATEDVTGPRTQASSPLTSNQPDMVPVSVPAPPSADGRGMSDSSAPSV